MNGKVLPSDTKVFIEGQEILGLDGADLSYSNSVNKISMAGFLGSVQSHSSFPNQTLSLSRNLIGRDVILDYIDSGFVKGSINYNGNACGFLCGSVEQYSLNCAVGSVPRSSASITIYDQIATGSFVDSYGTIPTQPKLFPRQGDIVISCNGYESNRVVGFDYSIKTNKKPRFVIGSQYPVGITKVLGNDYTASVQIDVDDLFLKNSMNFLNGVSASQLTLLIKSSDGTTIQSFSMPNAKVVGESLSVSANGGVKLNVTYNGIE